jgi:hypothetical protein
MKYFKKFSKYQKMLAYYRNKKVKMEKDEEKDVIKPDKKDINDSINKFNNLM